MMNPEKVRRYTDALRRDLELERAMENQDLPVEEQDRRITRDLWKKANSEKRLQMRIARQDVRFEHKLDFYNTDAERAVEDLLRKEVKEDKIINWLGQTIAKLEKKISQNDKKLLKLTQRILVMIQQQRLLLQQYMASLTDPNRRWGFLNQLLKLERGKKSLREEKLALLQENELWRRRIIHDRELITTTERQKQQTIRSMEERLRREETSAEEEKIRKLAA